MKTFKFSPLFIVGALVAAISGCATTAYTHSDSPKEPTKMGAAEKMEKGNCACCEMDKGEMGMKQDKASASHGAMCMPAKDGTGKSGCGSCDMGKMGADGCACCNLGKK